jgi:hypothetical protein
VGYGPSPYIYSIKVACAPTVETDDDGDDDDDNEVNI